MAQAQFIHDGETIDYTPGVDVAAGEVVVLADLVAVAKRDILAGTLGALAVVGVFDFAKSIAQSFSMGQLLYWNNTTKIATSTASGNKLIGKSVQSVATSVTTVRIRMSQ